MGVFSVASIFILNNAIASAFYISTSTIISLCARLCFEENAKERFQNILIKIFTTNKKRNIIILIIFTVIAVLPTVLRLACGEVTLTSTYKDIFIIFNFNLLANIFGVLLVFGIYNNLCKYNPKEIANSLMIYKDDVFKVYIVIGLNVSFMNAVNYEKDNFPSPSSWANCIHLLFIMFLGIVFFCSFMLRTIKNKEFYTPITYPTGILIIALVFLLCCGFLPTFIEPNEKSPQIYLLLLNTISFLLAAWSFYGLTKEHLNVTPWIQLILFTVIGIGNVIVTFIHIDYEKYIKETSIITELVSGFLILVASIVTLSYIRYKNKLIKKEYKEKTDIINIEK